MRARSTTQFRAWEPSCLVRSSVLTGLGLALALGCTGTAYNSGPDGAPQDDPRTTDPPPTSPEAGVSTDARPDGDAAPLAPEADAWQAVGIRLTTVSINQAVGIEVISDGAMVSARDRRAPIIGRRPALVRGLFVVDNDFEARRIEGRLVLVQEGGEEEVFRSVLDVSADADPASLRGAFRWDVPGESLRGNTHFRVVLLEDDRTTERSGDQRGARVPASGDADLEVLDRRMFLDLTVVPMCGMRLNDTDRVMIETYLYNTYPINELRIDYHAPIDQVCSLAEATYDVLPRLRAEENAPANRHYGGLLQANCGGLAQGIDGTGVNDPRAFSLCDWRDFGPTFDLLAHELGHTHGRDHSFEDRAYPHENRGSCGARVTFGYGLREGAMPSTHYSNDIEIGFPWVPMQSLIPPTDRDCGNNFDSWSDFMSYTYPYWVSAYTYAALADNIELTTDFAAAGQAGPDGPRTFRGILDDGTIYWTAVPGVARDQNHPVVAEARFYRGAALIERSPVYARPVHVDPGPRQSSARTTRELVVSVATPSASEHFEIVVDGELHRVSLDRLRY
ncbi:MAG: hypothetical protein AAGF12_17530 [Myxococcota bacterium]